MPVPVPDYNETNSTDAFGSGMGTDPDLVSFREPYDITLVSPGSSLLLYFFTDAGVNKAGFNVSYWYGMGLCGTGNVCMSVLYIVVGSTTHVQRTVWGGGSAVRRGRVSVWRGGQGSRVRSLPAPTTVLTMDSALEMDANV